MGQCLWNVEGKKPLSKNPVFSKTALWKWNSDWGIPSWWELREFSATRPSWAGSPSGWNERSSAVTLSLRKRWRSLVKGDEWTIGKVRATLLQLTWITSRALLYSTRNSTDWYVAAWMGEEFGGEWIHVYVWLSSFVVHLKLPLCSLAMLLLLSHFGVSDSLWPMDGSMPGLPVRHHLLKFAQVHIHCASDAIQLSHPLTPSSPSAVNLSQLQGPFQRVSCLHQVTKILELQYQPFQGVFRVDFH